MIHWTWIVFGIIAVILIITIIGCRRERNDIAEFVFWIILIGFIALWGGIFWW